MNSPLLFILLAQILVSLKFHKLALTIPITIILWFIFNWGLVKQITIKEVKSFILGSLKELLFGIFIVATGIYLFAYAISQKTYHDRIKSVEEQQKEILLKIKEIHESTK